jgi:UDP-N-acetylmuramyl tripeptide synthase
LKRLVWLYIFWLNSDVELLIYRAVVIVEDTAGVVANIAAAFYGRPSEKMQVIGVAGSSGVTATVHLIRAMYEASGLRTGMLSVVGHYVHGIIHLESTDAPPTIPDAVSVQKILAKLIHNGSEAVALDASIDGNGDEIDYDIAVFTNLRYDDADSNGSREEYIKSKARVFAKMVDPSRHRKVVNIDDPNVLYFLSQGSPDVPVVTYAMENKKADVHVIKHRLSLFETEVLVQTPHGILEISSGLLCRENVYNILAAVAVGVAVGIPLEDIVRGIEEVDAVPGRIELIDEEQAFGVVVDHAQTTEALSRLLDTVKELGPRRIITGLLFANLFFIYIYIYCVRNDI